MTELAILAKRIHNGLTLIAQTEEQQAQLRAEWVEAVLATATDLREAKRQLNESTNAFNVWLEENNFTEIKKNDRAALVNMADCLDLAREVLQQTDSVSVRLIWEDEIKPKFRNPNAGSSEFTKQETSVVGRIRERVENAVRECGVEGVTADELTEALGMSREVIAKRFSELKTDGLLIKTTASRAVPSGRNARVYVHCEFRGKVEAQTVKGKSKSRVKRGPVQIVDLNLPKLPSLTAAERELPSPEVADLPDPERPGLTRRQGYVAKYGQYQIMTMDQRRRQVAKGLHTMLRLLDKPLTDFLEQSLFSPDQLVAQIPALGKDADKVRQRITDALAAVNENAQKFAEFCQGLERALSNGVIVDFPRRTAVDD